MPTRTGRICRESHLRELDLREKVSQWREVLSPINPGTFALYASMIPKCEKRYFEYVRKRKSEDDAYSIENCYSIGQQRGRILFGLAGQN